MERRRVKRKERNEWEEREETRQRTADVATAAPLSYESVELDPSDIPLSP